MKPKVLLPAYILGLLGVAALIVIKGNGQKPPADSPAPSPKSETVDARAKFEPIDETLAASFSGENAFTHVQALTRIGPRPPASKGYEAALVYLEKEFSSLGWTTRRQTFVAPTPAGDVRFTNLLARFRNPATNWNESTPAIVGGHLDSKRFDSFSFVGANDGGSSTGVILELARVLAVDPSAASKIEFVLFDGEEAFGESITPTDGLYGSKYFSRLLLRRRTRPSLAIVLDLVGDDDHDFYYNPETPPSFAKAVEAAARKSGLTKLRRAPGQIIDDHIPLQNAGVPCLHLIGDFMNMPYWHQPGDTMDVIDADALKKTGRTTLRFLSEVSH